MLLDTGAVSVSHRPRASGGRCRPRGRCLQQEVKGKLDLKYLEGTSVQLTLDQGKKSETQERPQNFEAWATEKVEELCGSEMSAKGEQRVGKWAKF